MTTIKPTKPNLPRKRKKENIMEREEVVEANEVEEVADVEEVELGPSSYTTER